MSEILNKNRNQSHSQRKDEIMNTNSKSKKLTTYDVRHIDGDNVEIS